MERITIDELLKINKTKLKGKIICFPTDTVYGIGALYNDSEAIDKIYKMKNRPLNKPLANLCSNINQITSLGIKIPNYALDLMAKHWPGALTVILDGNGSKISFRMPDSIIALKLIDHLSVLATTSVNESGEIELNTFAEINLKFGNYIDYFISDYAIFSGLPSTVVDASQNELKIIRQGSVKI